MYRGVKLKKVNGYDWKKHPHPHEGI